MYNRTMYIKVSIQKIVKFYVIRTSGYTTFLVIGSGELGGQIALILFTEVTHEIAT